MSTQRYRYAMRVYRADGSCVGQIVTTVDWEPALEWAWLQGVRRGVLETTDGTRASAIRPLWQAELGEPFVGGFRVTIVSERRDGVSEDFTMAYLRPIARRVLLDLVHDGHLKEDETVRYQFVAFFDDAHAKAGPSSPFTTREVVPILPLTESIFSDVAGGAASEKTICADRAIATDRAAQGETTIAAAANNGALHAVDFPIVVPQRILDQTRDLTRGALPNETGGILIGLLHRDVESKELFVEITGQIPALHATGDVDRLTFTPETWAAARAALDLRNRQEIYLGWWHSHPVREWCGDCPKDKKAACALARGFLSADDRQLHRVAFPRAYTCALVVSDVADGDIGHSLFGWRCGVLERRGFHVSGNAEFVHVPAAADVPGERRSAESPSDRTQPEGGNHAEECSSTSGRRRSDPDASS